LTFLNGFCNDESIPFIRHSSDRARSDGNSTQTTLTIILVNIKIKANRVLTSDGSHLMYVCLCTGVTDGQIRDAILEGCCSYREVRQATGVASQCGKCACLAKQVVRETLTELQSSQAALPYAAEFSAA